MNSLLVTIKKLLVTNKKLLVTNKKLLVTNKKLLVTNNFWKKPGSTYIEPSESVSTFDLAHSREAHELLENGPLKIWIGGSILLFLLTRC